MRLYWITFKMLKDSHRPYSLHGGVSDREEEKELWVSGL